MDSVWWFLVVLSGVCCVEFRPDYTYDEQARGWFKFHATPAAWEEARLSCQGEGATLASPLTDELDASIARFLINQSLAAGDDGVTIFTGVHATFSDGDYSSIEGVPLLRLAIMWGPGEPNNVDDAERCLAMTVRQYGMMADTRCDRQLPYLCYKKNTETRFRFDYEWSEEAEGWFKYHVIPTTWNKAIARCAAEGAILASPVNKKINAAITSFAQNFDVFWDQDATLLTGLSNAYYNSARRSLDGEIIDESVITWKTNKHNSDSCIAMTIDENIVLTYQDCEKVHPYVCYKANDSLTVTECGTTDPDYVMKKTGSCYKFHKIGQTWSKAYMTCAAEGGYLAIINTKTEADVVKNIIDKYPHSVIVADQTGLISVGIHDWNHFGRDFLTIHGEPLYTVYNEWMQGEPNNGTNAAYNHKPEYCITVERSDVKLNDYECDVPVAFLCEKNPHSLLNDEDFFV